MSASVPHCSRAVPACRLAPAQARAAARSARDAQQGLSLIELMVALALGMVLLLGLVEVFSSIQASFRAAQGLSRSQENGRFSFEFLRRDLRMVGHMGCRNEYQLITAGGDRGFWNHLSTTAADTLAGQDSAPYAFRLHRTLEVHDYSATGGTSPGNTFTPALATFPAGVTIAANFTPPLPTELTDGSGNLGTTGLLGNDYGDLVPGSDVIVARYLTEDVMRLPGDLQRDVGQLNGAAAADFPVWRVFALSNCGDRALSLFQITSAGPPVVSLAAGTANLNRQAWGYSQEPEYTLTKRSEVFPYEMVIYHVGRTSPSTPPALFRRRLLTAPTSAAQAANFGAPEELVPDVEMMQVLLGVDNVNANNVANGLGLGCGVLPTASDDHIDNFCSAAEHLPNAVVDADTRFALQRAVKTLRVSLMVRSPEPLGAGAPTVATRVVGDVVVTPPTDGRLRYVYETTIALRNRVRE